MKKRLKFGLIVVFIFSVIALAGCGREDAAETTGEPAGDSDSISSGEILIASDTAYPPFEFQDQNTGEYIGFDMDLIKAIAGVNGWNYKIRSVSFDDIVPALEDSSIDMAISAMTITEERREKIDFSYPYYRSDQSVAVQAGNEEIKSFKDLEGKHLGVQIETAGAVEADKIPNAKVIGYDTINEAFMALKNGDIDAVVNDFPVNAFFIKQGNEDIKIVDVLNTNEHYGIAVPKEKPEILEQVNSALETLKENGKYAEIYKQWFNEDPPEYLPGEPPQH